MTSSVHFKMHHGNDVLAVNFAGHQIKLLDLKRSVMELKNIAKGLDFDLKITDADSGKGQHQCEYISYFLTIFLSFFFLFFV